MTRGARRAFLDTNVLVYLFDGGEPAKQQRARQVLADEANQIVVSTQVLGEFYVTVTRKLATPLPPDSAADAVERLQDFQVVTTDSALVRSAVRTSIRSQISYWDALVVEAAASIPCDVLLTEDLSHGTTLRGVSVENPFG